MATPSDNPITQVNEPDLSSIITQVSPNSPNPGAKPARPVRRRKPKRKEGDNTTTTTTTAATEAGEEGEEDGEEEDDEEDGNGVGHVGLGVDTSEDTVTSTGPAAAAGGGGPTTTTGPTPVSQPALESSTTTDKPSPAPLALTGDQDSTIKTINGTPDVATVVPSTTTTTTPAAPTSVPTIRAPAPSSSTTRPNTTPTSKPRSIKKSGGGCFATLFSCFGGGNTHPEDAPPRQQPKPLTSEKTNTAGTSSSAASSTPLNEKTNLPSDSTTTSSPTNPKVLPPAITTTNLTPSPTPSTEAPPSASPSPTGIPLSPEETEGVTSAAVMAPGKEATATATATPGKTRRRRSGKQPESIITQVPEPGQHGQQRGYDDEDSEGSYEDEEEEEDEEQSLIARGGVGIPIGEDGLPHPLLDELAPELKGRKCLVLDLDETLVHSSFKMVHQADYVVPVEIENQYHNVYVIKRPGVDAFLKAMGEIYEVVIFTASLSKYADPVLDQLDIHRVVQHRLFRESCYNNKGNYVKDLSQLGRPMTECIIIDNSPASYVFHVNNAVPISSWFNDPHDTELTDLVPFLTDLEKVDDVRSVLDAGLYQQLQSEGLPFGL